MSTIKTIRCHLSSFQSRFPFHGFDIHTLRIQYEYIQKQCVGVAQDCNIKKGPSFTLAKRDTLYRPLISDKNYPNCSAIAAFI